MPVVAPVFPRSWLHDGAPDWAAIDRTVKCSRCAYDLRMLQQPRCPECGLDFSWRELLSAEFETSRYFEHQWRRRPVRSLLRTLIASLRARCFWGRLSIHLRVDRIGHWLQLVAAIAWLVILVQLLLYAGFWLAAWLNWALTSNPMHPLAAHVLAKYPSWNRTGLFAAMINQPTFTEILLREIHDFSRLWSRGPVRGWFLCAAVSCIAIQFIALVSLRQTLERCRVRAGQMLRVIAGVALSTGTNAAVLMALFPVLVAWQKWHVQVSSNVRLPLPRFWVNLPMIGCMLAGILALIWWRGFALALGAYLHLPRATFVAFLTGLLTFLAVLTAPLAWFWITNPG